MKKYGKRKQDERGLTLLEYAAGAAFILATAAVVMVAMRTSMETAFAGIGDWLVNTTAEQLGAPDNGGDE